MSCLQVSFFIVLMITQLASLFAVPRGARVKRVVGGRNAVRGELPYQVLITNQKTQEMCGGSIIHQSFVLTAKHCADKTRWKNLIIEAGLVCTTERLGVPRRFVSKAYYPKMNKSAEKNTDGHFQEDIALLKLDVPFAMDFYGVHPVPIREDIGYQGKDCIVSGWGELVNGTTTKRLQVGEVEAFPRNKCKGYNHGRLSGDLMCAGHVKGGTDACQGDSGGPLVCNGLLTGIVKSGTGCGLQDYPGKYTEVAHYAKRIADIIRNSTYNSRWSRVTGGRS